MANDGGLDQGGRHVESLMLAIANSGTGIWDRDVANGRIVYCAAWKAMLGYAEHEVGDLIEESYTRVHPDDLQHVQTAISAHFDDHTDSYAVEHRLRCKDGRYKWVLSRGKVVTRDADGKPLRMTGTTTDITQTVALSEKLRQSAELLTHLTDEVPGLVYQYCRTAEGHSRFTYASAGITSIFGTTPAFAAINASFAEAQIHPDDRDTYHGSMAVSAETMERWHLEFRVVLPGIGERWREADARPHRQEDGSVVWHGFISDITDHKQLEQKLQNAAATDFLTGLPNRRHMMARMEQELARLERDPLALAAVMMFDLDLFKSINDQHGHAMGDEVLRHFSSLLMHELRKVDAVGRIGGEEFAIILSGADMDDAVRFAERVRARLAATPLRDGALCITITVSIGISAMLASDANIASSLSRADEALYLAKRRGRNRVEIAPDTTV
jgi:diguanylate cyclase (GGDEF)-like protein/PAS domain S-box-containing protein